MTKQEIEKLKRSPSFQRGLRDRKEGRMTPISEIQREFGLDDGTGLAESGSRQQKG